MGGLNKGSDMPAKLPFLKFFPADWVTDPNLSMCSASTRGIWIDMICAMHQSDRSGTLTGTPDQLARVCRCSPSDVHSAVCELKATGTADVRECNGVVTVINRRMQREYRERVATTRRVVKHRCNGRVTDLKRDCNAGEDRRQKTEDPPNPPQAGGSVDRASPSNALRPKPSANGESSAGPPAAPVPAKRTQTHDGVHGRVNGHPVSLNAAALQPEPFADPSPEAVDRSDAETFARCWLSANLPSCLRGGVPAMARMVLAAGKEGAVKAVQEAAQVPGVSNAVAYAEKALDGERMKAQAKRAVPKERFFREDN